MERESLRSLHLLPMDGDVLGLRSGIAGVGVDFCRIATASEEAERDFQCAWRPVCHAAEVPFVTVTARYGDELAGAAVQHARGVPGDGHVLDELERGLP